MTANILRYSEMLFSKCSKVSRKIHLPFYKSYTSASVSHCITVNEKIKHALAANQPVVALETAIVTHGMQFPFNLQTALEVESLIEAEGAIAASIGVIGGDVIVGLAKEQLEFLATSPPNCFKVSRRDFPFVVAKSYNGGTTVSGTIAVSSLVGIPIFVTGGIGGVHRGGEKSMDVSADLTELGRSPVAVVSAGVKSILDIGKTLEFLETQGVGVFTMGSSRTFPDFFTRDSGFEAPYNVESCTEAARVILARKDLGLVSGMLFAVPIPITEEADGLLIKKAIDEALSEAERSVKGRDVTPFVLKRVADITEGKSVIANINLIKNNARYGARIAVEYQKILKSKPMKTDIKHGESGRNSSSKSPVVIGGSIVDLSIHLGEDLEINGSTHKGCFSQTQGGVGRNLSEALTKLGCSPFLISAVGNDAQGNTLCNRYADVDTRGIMRCEESPTASYCLLIDKGGDVLFGVGDMTIHDRISGEWVKKFEHEIRNSPLVVMDGNVSMETMQTVFEICSSRNVPVWYEPTDIRKASKPWMNGSSSRPSFASPNLNEFKSIVHCTSQGKAPSFEARSEEKFLKQILETCKMWIPPMNGLMITFGAEGFMIVRWGAEDEENAPLLPYKNVTNASDNDVIGLYFKSRKLEKIKSVSGAGDCLASGFIAGMLQRRTVSECASIGLSCAALSMRITTAIPESLNDVDLKNGNEEEYVVVSL